MITSVFKDVIIHSCPNFSHYNDVIMGAMASQIASLTIVYSIVYSGADQRKHQSSASLAFVRGIHGWPAQMASNAENVSIWWRHHERRLRWLKLGRGCVITFHCFTRVELLIHAIILMLVQLIYVAKPGYQEMKSTGFAYWSIVHKFKYVKCWTTNYMSHINVDTYH